MLKEMDCGMDKEREDREEIAVATASSVP